MTPKRQNTTDAGFKTFPAHIRSVISRLNDTTTEDRIEPTIAADEDVVGEVAERLEAAGAEPSTEPVRDELDDGAVVSPSVHCHRVGSHLDAMPVATGEREPAAEVALGILA